MAYLGKEFKHEKDENFDAFVESLGIPDGKAERLRNLKPSSKIVKNGDEYVLTYIGLDGSKDLKFKNGVEFDEEVAENIVVKSVFKINGDVIIQEQKLPDGRGITFKREFSADKLVVTITCTFWDGKAVRHYAAA